MVQSNIFHLMPLTLGARYRIAQAHFELFNLFQQVESCIIFFISFLPCIPPCLHLSGFHRMMKLPMSPDVARFSAFTISSYSTFSNSEFSIWEDVVPTWTTKWMCLYTALLKPLTVQLHVNEWTHIEHSMLISNHVFSLWAKSSALFKNSSAPSHPSTWK